MNNVIIKFDGANVVSISKADILKHNENHDASGKFSSGSSGEADKAYKELRAAQTKYDSSSTDKQRESARVRLDAAIKEMQRVHSNDKNESAKNIASGLEHARSQSDKWKEGDKVVTHEGKTGFVAGTDQHGRVRVVTDINGREDLYHPNNLTAGKPGQFGDKEGQQFKNRVKKFDDDVLKYSPDQPRAADGKWGSGGSTVDANYFENKKATAITAEKPAKREKTAEEKVHQGKKPEKVFTVVNPRTGRGVKIYRNPSTWDHNTGGDTKGIVTRGGDVFLWKGWEDHHIDMYPQMVKEGVILQSDVPQSSPFWFKPMNGLVTVWGNRKGGWGGATPSEKRYNQVAMNNRVKELFAGFPIKRAAEGDDNDIAKMMMKFEESIKTKIVKFDDDAKVTHVEYPEGVR